jgi:hypothetical protein
VLDETAAQLGRALREPEIPAERRSDAFLLGFRLFHGPLDCAICNNLAPGPV